MHFRIKKPREEHALFMTNILADTEYDADIEKHLAILRGLRHENGLFIAAAHEGVTTGYDKAWLRDNFYMSLAFVEREEWETVRTLWHAILDVFLKHEYKINWAIKDKPRYTYQYIHARYDPVSFEEFWEEWGNKQNDAVGAILFALGTLEARSISILRSDDDRRVVQRLVDYLGALAYWEDPDNGVWEEYEEVHSSSIGACLAGLEAVTRAGIAEVPEEWIARGREALFARLPRESDTKFSDLALLSLIFPYALLSREQEEEILRHLTYHLSRDRGVIRYKNDRYYNKNSDGYSEEAEWTMGFPWLSIIHRARGEHDTADRYLVLTRERLETSCGLPELFYSDSDQPNENTPLGWAESLHIIALNRARGLT